MSRPSGRTESPRLPLPGPAKTRVTARATRSDVPGRLPTRLRWHARKNPSQSSCLLVRRSVRPQPPSWKPVASGRPSGAPKTPSRHPNAGTQPNSSTDANNRPPQAPNRLAVPHSRRGRGAKRSQNVLAGFPTRSQSARTKTQTTTQQLAGASERGNAPKHPDQSKQQEAARNFRQLP